MSFLDPMPVDLTGKVESVGESLTLSGHVDVGGYEFGDKRFALDDGVSFEVVFTNVGEGILLTGMVRGGASAACDRCLAPAHVDIAGAIEEYYLFEKPRDPAAYEDGFELIGTDRTVDLASPLSDAVIMDTPFVLLCHPDCAGICPRCGADLNLGPCSCSEGDAEDAANPFEVLRDLKLDR